MGLRFDPIGGGQFKAALQQIMESERQPIKTLEARKAHEEARMKLFQEFKTKFSELNTVLDDFKDFRKFRELKVDLGNGKDLISVTLDKERAQPGSYTLEIDALAEKSSIISNAHDDPDEKNLGVGYIVSYDRDGNKNETYIDEEHASLHGIANAINNQPNLPVRASVVKDDTDPDSRWKIIVSSREEGLIKGQDFPEFYFMDGEDNFYIDDNHDPQNAILSIDNFEIESSGNKITDFLEGVNVELLAAREDEPFTFQITEDYEKIAGKVKALIDKLNGILEFVNKQNKLDDKSNTKDTFGGDTGLQGIEYRLREILHDGYPVDEKDSDTDADATGQKLIFVSDVGIQFEKTGLLSFKEDKFKQAMQKNFPAIAQLVTGPEGFATTIRKTLESYTSPANGTLALRERGLQTRIGAIDKQISDKERLLDQKQQSLTAKFSRLEASLGDLQRQQQYLTATMGSGGGNNLVQQLLGG